MSQMRLASSRSAARIGVFVLGIRPRSDWRRRCSQRWRPRLATAIKFREGYEMALNATLDVSTAESSAQREKIPSGSPLLTLQNTARP